MAQNLCQQSEDFNNVTSWVKSNCSVTTDVIANPLTGAVTADRLNDDSANNIHVITTFNGATLSRINTYSVYAKAGTMNYVALSGNNVGFIIFFDLLNGLRGQTGGNTTEREKIVGAGIEPVIGQTGWYRCWVSFWCTNIGGCRIYISNADGNQTYIGDTTGNIFLWGAQLSLSSMPIPYVAATTVNIDTGVPRSIIPSSQNLLLQSQTINNATWTKTRCTAVVTSGGGLVTGPNGVAEIITDDNTSATHFMTQSANLFLQRSRATFTVFAKAGTASWLGVFGHGTSGIGAAFDLANGVIGTVDTTFGVRAFIEPVIGFTGWYKCSMSYPVSTTTITKSATVALFMENGNGTITFTGGLTLYINGTSLSITDGPIPYTSTLLQIFDQGSPRSIIPIQNLAKFSEDITNAAYTKVNITTATGITDPLGGSTACSMTDDATNATHRFQQTLATIPENQRVTISLWAKAIAGTPWIGLSGNNGGLTVYVNLATGARGTISANCLCEVSPTAINGWWKISFTYTATVVGAGVCVVYMASADATVTYVGGSNTIGIWRFQLVRAGTAGNYAKTTSSIIDIGSPRTLLMPQNLFLASEDFNNALWTSKSNITVTSGATAAPITGLGNVADRFNDSNDGAPAQHYDQQQVSPAPTIGAMCTVSVYAKAGNLTGVLGISPNGAALGKTFDLTNGTVGSNINGAPVDAGMDAVPGFTGWYRCWVKFRYDGNTFVRLYMATTTGNVIYTGNGLGTMFIFGAMYTQTDGQVPYIKTTSAVVNNGIPRSPIYGQQNLLVQSEDFSTTWTVSNTTVTTNQIANPLTGLVDADQMNGVATGAALVLQNRTLTIGATYTISVYAKAGTRGWIVLYGGATQDGAFFDLTNGLLGSDSGSQTGQIKQIFQINSPYGAGWYRCCITWVNRANTSSRIHITTGDAANNPVITSVDNIYIWGAQINQGTSVLPYVKTTAATVNTGLSRALIEPK